MYKKYDSEIWTTIWEITPYYYGSGSRVYFQSDEPSLTDYNDGDFWVNPTGYTNDENEYIYANTLHIYNSILSGEFQWKPLANEEFDIVSGSIIDIANDYESIQTDIDKRTQTFVQSSLPNGYENITIYVQNISSGSPLSAGIGDIWHEPSGSKMYEYEQSEEFVEKDISPEEFYVSQNAKIGDIWYNVSNGSAILVYTASTSSGDTPFFPPTIPDTIVYGFSDVGLSPALMTEINSKNTIYYVIKFSDLEALTTANSGDLGFADGKLYKYVPDASPEWNEVELNYLTENSLTDLQDQIDTFSSDNIITGTEKTTNSTTL